MRRVILIFLMAASTCFASGWHDFQLDIGDGYSIVRCNQMDIVFCNKNNNSLVHPDIHPDLGPIIEYSTTPKYVFTKNFGRKTDDPSEPSTFQQVDPSREFYCIVNKVTEEVIGPLSLADFQKRSEVMGLTSIEWKEPENPDKIKPFIGNIFFIGFIAFIYGFIPVTLVVIVIKGYRRNLDKKLKTNQY